MKSVISLLRRSLTLIMAAVAAFGGLFGGSAGVKEGSAALVNEYEYNLETGLCFGQGLACDGEYFYGFGALKPLDYNCITKINALTGEVVEINELCLPRELVLKGYSHLGDGCVVDGRLYIALEDFGFRHPAVAIYSADTLEFIEYHVIPDECRGNGRIPWCAIKDGTLYFSQSNDVDEIRMLNLEDFSFAGVIKLDKTLYKMQGGEFWDGKLYVVTNSEKYDKPVFEIDVETGSVQTKFIRNVGALDMEGEGIAICPLPDGSLFHILDVGTVVRLSSFSF